MGSGASGFDEVESAETFMSEAPIEAPASLTEMMDSEGAASLFGSMFNQKDSDFWANITERGLI